MEVLARDSFAPPRRGRLVRRRANETYFFDSAAHAFHRGDPAGLGSLERVWRARFADPFNVPLASAREFFDGEATVGR